MNILWFTWKDKKNPRAGGAEMVNEEIAKRLVKDNHRVTFLVAGYKGGKFQEVVDGYKIIRVGGRYTSYFKAYRYYKNNLEGWPDLIIEEINTIPFFTQWYSQKNNPKRILLIYQLCREIWFYQERFPINLFGYFIEQIYLRFLNNNICITESISTKNDLLKYGFKENNIFIFPVGIDLQPVQSLEVQKKFENFTLLSYGSVRKMKRIDQQIRAFEIAKRQIPGLQLKIAGSFLEPYGKKIKKMVDNNPYKKDIEFVGKTTLAQKVNLMKKSHVLLMTSVKEGWGLVVTEAASQGTPSIGYDADGIRDSIKNNLTGIITKSNIHDSLSQSVIKLYNDKRLYQRLRKNAWEWSKQFTYTKSYQKFKKILQL